MILVWVDPQIVFQFFLSDLLLFNSVNLNGIVRYQCLNRLPFYHISPVYLDHLEKLVYILTTNYL